MAKKYLEIVIQIDLKKVCLIFLKSLIANNKCHLSTNFLTLTSVAKNIKQRVSLELCVSKRTSET